MGDLTRHFSWSEFECRCGCPMPCAVRERVRMLAETLESLRAFLGDPIRVNSGYLCPARNDAVGGAKKSRHLQGDACDIEVAGYTGKRLREIIEELIGLARDMRAASARGDQLGLTNEEVAFYDALETNDSAVKVLGDATLRTIAQELVRTVRANVTIDWTVRENVRAQLRVLVKRILRKYGYPPDKQEKATQTVLEQAEGLSEAWSAA